MLDRLRSSYEREARFVADASHELRTPAAVIKAELEAALRASPGPEAREAIVAALEECDQLIGLAEDLLVLARTDERGLPIHVRTLVASALLEGVRRRFADRAHERDRAIRVRADDGLHLEGDELRLRQALGNLVDNALRHGAGEIELRATGADGAIVLEVADHGPGLPPGLAGRAFERFARGDTARAGSGAGLGLAIVRAIAEAHGGRAEIGDGAVVRIRLPPQRDLSGPA
jgi:signal transduction histidine kinase